MLDGDITTSRGAPAVDDGRLFALLTFAADREGASGQVSVWICTDAEIADLHQRFMGIPGPTDVISFPSGEEPGGSPDAYLGDIAVSYETAEMQAADAGHGVAREIAYLALHGLLHLLGYDDLTPEDRQRMIARQDRLLSEFEREYPGDWA